MQLSSDARTLANTLIDGAQKTVTNADELFDEARLLANSGHVARAVLLHQISLEECGKLDMIFAATAQIILGQTVNMKQLVRAFNQHAAKNRTNAYFLAKSEAERAAAKQDDVGAAHQAFVELQSEFHKKSNALKNASLYVDYESSFRAPRDVITAEHLDDVFNRNSVFMSMAFDKQTILLRWKADLDAAAAEVAGLCALLGMSNLDQDKSETLAAFKNRFAAMVEKGLSFRPLSDDD